MIIIGKCILSIFLIGLFFAILSSAKVKEFIDKNFKISLGISFIVFRVLPFVCIYVILSQPAQSDVEAFLVQANEALKLKIVYNDYESFYAPLFTYILALPIYVVNSGKSIIFFMILMEFLAVIGTYLCFKNKNLAASKLYSVAYFILPAPLVFTVFGGQEDIWLWLFISWGLFFTSKFKNYVYLGVFLILTFISTKIIIILFTIPFLVFFYQKRGLLASMLIAGLPCLGLFYWVFQNNVFMPLHESGSIYAPNVWTLILPFTRGQFPIDHKLISFIGLSIGIGLTILICKNRFRKGLAEEHKIVLIWVVSYILMIILSKKSLGNYLSIFMLPLLFTTNFNNFNKVLFALVNVVGVIQPSIWFRIGMPLYKSFDQPFMFLFEYALELIFVLTLCLILYKVFSAKSSSYILS